MPDITGGMAQFLSEPNLATIATIRKNGAPHLTYLWFLQDGNDILMTTARGRVKSNNLRRDNRATIAILDPKSNQRFFIAEGRVEVSDDPQANFYARVGTKYMGEERAKAIAQAAVQRGERRIILRLRPERIYSRGM